MKTILPATITALFLTISAVGFSSKPETKPSGRQYKPLVVFLVRHGEKVDASRDPKLSAAGLKRAEALARTLRSAEIEYVHSSNYIRTRNTAAPTAKIHKLKTELYDPRNLPALLKKLRSSGGRHLVVGHSNTTPKMVELLCGKPQTEINEANEYDRLYIVTIGSDGKAVSVQLSYGKPYDSGRN